VRLPVAVATRDLDEVPALDKVPTPLLDTLGGVPSGSLSVARNSSEKSIAPDAENSRDVANSRDFPSARASDCVVPDFACTPETRTGAL
jgi:hypothetical protein